ncbi:MAG: ABC transporter substrate-binding protein [Desulfobacterales bacterium]
MGTRRILIGLPLAVSALLLQSVFWVPTYEEQARGNPARLEEFIQASIGDAAVLNPILSSDAASAEIEQLVFEGLLDRDEHLRLRGKLAESWSVREEAFFHVPAGQGGQANEAVRVAALLRERRARPEGLPPAVQAAVANIEEIAIEPPRRETREITDASGQPLRLHLSVPPRIRLLLARVDPELFAHLEAVLGEGYFLRFRPEEHLEAERPLPEEEKRRIAGEALPPVEHNPVIEFRLRPGLTFHDGRPLTAEDVRFTWQAVMDPRNLSPRASDFEPVKEVRLPDPLTAVVVYKRLHAPALASWTLGILPRHLLDETALRAEAIASGKDPAAFGIRQSRFNRRPVGCGPFAFREWKSDRHIRLERFAGYFEGPPEYRRFSFRVIPDLLTQEMEFYAGTIDAYAVQPHQVARLAGDPRFQHFSGTSFAYTYIGYNLRRPPFDDPRVRRALGLAVPVDRIIEAVLYGQAERTSGPFPRQTPFYNPEVEPLPHDPEAARRLLEEAGWRPGPEGLLEKDGRRLRFTLITNSGNDVRKSILTIVQDAWKRLGVEVRTDLVEWAVFIRERIHRLDFDAVVLGWSMGVEPDLHPIWHSSQTGPHQLNFIGYGHPEADALITRIREEYDPERQIALCRKLHARIAADQPVTFLYAGRWTAVLDRRIVIRERRGDEIRHRPIEPTATGNYRYHFNRWVKLAERPVFAVE